MMKIHARSNLYSVDYVFEKDDRRLSYCATVVRSPAGPVVRWISDDHVAAGINDLC
jgi:hypothetical protein